MMTWKKILLPFQIGYHLDSREGGDGVSQPVQSGADINGPTPRVTTGRSTRIKQDGFVSSLMWFLLIMSISFGVTLARWITTEQSLQISSTDIESVLITYMLIATVIMWVFCLHKHIPYSNKYIIHNVRNSRLQFGESGESDISGMVEMLKRRIQEKLQTCIPLFGILIFFILGVFLDVMRVICVIPCIHSVREHHREFIHTIVSLIFHITRLLFQSTLIKFAFVFHNKAFKRRTGVRYALLMILAATLAVWFDTLLYDSRAMFNGHGSDDEPEEDYSYVPPLVSHMINRNSLGNYTYDCLQHKTKLHDIYRGLAPYLYPLHIEFALMICEILSHMYFTVQEPENAEGELDEVQTGTENANNRITRQNGCHGNRPDNQHAHDIEERAEGSDGVEIPSVLNPDSDDEIINLREDDRAGLLTSTVTPPVGATTGLGSSWSRRTILAAEVEQMLPHWSMPSMLPIAVILNLVFVTLGGLTYLDNINEKTEESYIWRFTYEITKTIYFAIICLLNIVGFMACAENCVSNFYPYTGLDYIFIVSSTAQNLLFVLDFIAILGFFYGSKSTGDPPVPIPNIPQGMAPVVLTGRIINTVQFILQIPFTLHTARIKTTNPRTKAYIKGVILMLVVSNFAIWAGDSFIEIKNSKLEPISTYYYNPHMWGTISHLLLPFFLFLRFNSVLVLIGVYMTH